jgi:hypothetical protein
MTSEKIRDNSFPGIFRARDDNFSNKKNRIRCYITIDFQFVQIKDSLQWHNRGTPLRRISKSFGERNLFKLSKDARLNGNTQKNR